MCNKKKCFLALIFGGCAIISILFLVFHNKLLSFFDEDRILKNNNIFYKYESYSKTSYYSAQINHNTKLVSIYFNLGNKQLIPKTYDNQLINFVASKSELIEKLTIVSQINKPILLTLFDFTIDSDIMLVINKLPTIQMLFLGNCKIDSCTLEKINSSPQFFVLVLVHSTTTKNWNDFYNNIPNLSGLYFWDISLSVTEWESLFLTDLKIKELQIISSKVAPNSFKSIEHMPSLEHIKLQYLRLSNIDLEALCNLPNLSTLLFIDCEVDSNIVKLFDKHPTLKYFKIMKNNKIVYEISK